MKTQSLRALRAMVKTETVCRRTGGAQEDHELIFRLPNGSYRKMQYKAHRGSNCPGRGYIDGIGDFTLPATAAEFEAAQFHVGNGLNPALFIAKAIERLREAGMAIPMWS